MDRIQTLIVGVLGLVGDRPVGAVELAKHLYLLDVHALRTFGEPLSPIVWKRYPNGPYATDILTARDALREMGLVEVREVETEYGKPKQEHRLRANPASLRLELEPHEYELLNAVVASRAHLDRSALCGQAYETEPMRAMLEIEEMLSSGDVLEEHQLNMDLVTRRRGPKAKPRAAEAI